MSASQRTSHTDSIGRSAGFLDVARAVFWSFLGIRRKADYHEDAARLKPHHVVIAGILGAVLLVLSLLLVVRIVVSQ